MRRTVLLTLTVCLLRLPFAAQADEQKLQSLIRQLTARPADSVIVTRGLPRPGAPVAQPDITPASAAGRRDPDLQPERSALGKVSQTRAVASPVDMTSADTAGRPSADLNVLFATGSTDLTPGAIHLLQDLGRALSAPAMGQSRFLIEGHTDTVGDDVLNRSLSERRANAVANFLVHEFQFPAGRLATKCCGKDGLLVSTPDQTPELRNRRVHVVNLDG
jgi:OOP family OmpA-OmpF porin